MVQRYVNEDGTASVWEGSVANFYSPMESPEDSGDELEEDTHVRIPKKFKRKHPLTPVVSSSKLQSPLEVHCFSQFVFLLFHFLSEEKQLARLLSS